MATTKSRLLVLSAVACLLCFHGSATAQKMLSGSAWRSVTQFGAIPAHTRVRVRTTEPIDTTMAGCQRFEGVVAKDVMGGSGNVLVSKGSNVEMSVDNRSDGQLALDLDSIETNGEQFVAEGTREPIVSVNIAGVGSAYGAQIPTSGERIVIPEGSIVTFRLDRTFQPAS
jgi:hypothetical protein